MSLGLAALLVFVASAATYLATRLISHALRPRCPRCSGKQLAHVPASGRDSLFARYRCGACAAHWVACSGGLVSREAFAAGARDPFPAATLRR